MNLALLRWRQIENPVEVTAAGSPCQGLSRCISAVEEKDYNVMYSIDGLL
jgi:hypothetical protein